MKSPLPLYIIIIIIIFIFYTNTFKNSVTNEINVILPTLTGKPMSHNKNNRDNYVTLNVAFQKPKTQAARDSLTQPTPLFDLC